MTSTYRPIFAVCFTNILLDPIDLDCWHEKLVVIRRFHSINGLNRSWRERHHNRNVHLCYCCIAHLFRGGARHHQPPCSYKESSATSIIIYAQIIYINTVITYLGRKIQGTNRTTDNLLSQAKKTR